MKLKKILEDVAKKDESVRSALSEIKLPRVYKHFQSKEYPVAIITAFRGGSETPEIYKRNVANNRKLASEIRAAGYGYDWVDGGWKESSGDGGELKDVEEDSILIVGRPNDGGKLFNLLIDKAKEYNQDGFLFKPEGETNIYILYQSGEIEQISNKFRLDKFEYGYTKLRGRGKGKVFSFHEERNSGGWIAHRTKYERMKKLEESLKQNNKI